MVNISESIIASANEGAMVPQPMSYYIPDHLLTSPSMTGAVPEMDRIERAARAVVTRMGYDPDALACRYTPRQVGAGIMIVPPSDHQRPLWTFFTAEAEAALSVLDI
ncbi:hypothetical protein FHT87_005174 [Rhizobium sp. BK316]|nr:hypothetical protein [Rhizobium sp. BK316]